MIGGRQFSVVLVTTPSPEEGRRIARAVLELRLAACVNLVPGVRSMFWWQGKLEEAEETLMVLKTKQEVLPQLIEEIKRLHSYTVCEVIVIPITEGNPAYLDWIEETVRP
ncbi:MAG: divalent-cation tolerance protein CutA [Dehalococcoidia bacterium]|nr:divalent-cation tolerance protein CutA [Dehalococcoidia bacterium]